MEHIDLRKLNASELGQVCRQVVRLKEMGKSGKEIEEITGERRERIFIRRGERTDRSRDREDRA